MGFYGMYQKSVKYNKNNPSTYSNHCNNKTGALYQKRNTSTPFLLYNMDSLRTRSRPGQVFESSSINNISSDTNYDLHQLGSCLWFTHTVLLM